MKNKIIKRVFSTVGIILALLITVFAAYIIYLVVDYNRIEDNQTLKVNSVNDSQIPVNKKISLMTSNIGFGAYSQDYSFFMSGGEHSWAYSKEEVLKNTDGIIDAVKSAEPDILLLQEVDVDGTRSYHVNQKDIFSNSLKEYNNTFAVNYDSSFLFYPFNQPHGANKSGIMTFSKYEITSGLRRQLPIENSVMKIVDLDRCYSVSRIPAENGKELVLYNVHLSAYTSDGTISDEQLKMLSKDMKKEYKSGNYVIAGGDFNKDLLGDSSKYFDTVDEKYNWSKPIDLSLLPSGFQVSTGTNAPSCRDSRDPYTNMKDVFVVTLDGIITAPNVQVVTAETVDMHFKYSDHNPVKFEIILK